MSELDERVQAQLAAFTSRFNLPIPAHPCETASSHVPPSDMDAPDPFEGVRTTGDVEQDDHAEAASLLQTIRQQVKDRGDAGFWVGLVFTTRAQCDAFLAATGWDRHLIHDSTYLDGIAVADALHIPLPESLPPQQGRLSKTARLSREIGITETP